MAGSLSEEEILNKVYDSTDDTLVISTGITTQGQHDEKLSVQEILNKVYDSANRRLKVK